MKSFRCKHCHRSLPADPRVKDQQYCSQADCQAARKKAWLRKKMTTDPDYVENQCLAQKKWRENHPGYWRNYRKKHPKCVFHDIRPVIPREGGHAFHVIPAACSSDSGQAVGAKRRGWLLGTSFLGVTSSWLSFSASILL